MSFKVEEDSEGTVMIHRLVVMIICNIRVASRVHNGRHVSAKQFHKLEIPLTVSML